MLNGDYIKHDILFAMDLLMVGIKSDDKQILMRAALNILEMLLRNINNQMKSSQCENKNKRRMRRSAEKDNRVPTAA